MISAVHTQFCDEISHNASSLCRIEGYYCPSVISANYTKMEIFYRPDPADLNGHAIQVLDQSRIHCFNQRAVRFCPSGHFCPNSQEMRICPKGYFCDMGYATPQICPWFTLACSAVGLRTPRRIVMIFLFPMILLLMIGLYYWFEVCYYRRENNKSKKYSDLLNELSTQEQQQQQQLHQQQQLLQQQGLQQESRDIETFVESPNLSVIELQQQRRQQQTTQHCLLNHLQCHSNQQQTTVAAEAFRSFDFKKAEVPLTVSFDGLTLTLPNGHCILNNVFGTIKPFEITAIIGKTGAGKTTLLNLLRGQAHYAQTTGRFLVNGQDLPSLNILSKEVGFVPQNDICYEELTVEDNIMFSAMLFNRRGFHRREELVAMVYQAERILGIEHIRFTVVGKAGSNKERISGGEKKRVSIGMELVKETAFLFLDEPTSGLDSATSVSVLLTLHELASLGMNIVATLHQPRPEIVQRLHSIIILSEGRIIFQGTPLALTHHLSMFGYECPVNGNIADFVLDVLATNIVSTSIIRRNKTAREISQEFADHWETIEHKKHVIFMEESTPRYQPAADSAQSQPQSQQSLNDISFLAERSSKDNFYRTCKACFFRQKKVYYQNFFDILWTCFVLWISGLTVGLMQGTVRLHLGQSSPPSTIIPSVTFSQLVFGIFSTNANLFLFGNDELMRQREENGGIHLLPLFFGKLLSSYVEFFFYSYAFVSGYYPVIESNTGFMNYLSVFLLLQLSLSAISNLLAIAVEVRSRSLTTLCVVVMFWLFGGVRVI
jgi:ABC-type multidrug transport system ATPase subunit